MCVRQPSCMEEVGVRLSLPQNMDVGDIKYKTPQFNRDKLLLKDNELKKLDSNTTILGSLLNN